MKSSASDFILNLPVYNAGSDIQYGAIMKRGVTGTQPYGALVPATASAAHVNVVGRILAKNVYATDGDTLANGTVFTTKPVELAIMGARIWEIPYSLASGDSVQCTQAVSTTTITVTSLEDDIDTAFLYTDTGTGIGQLNYLTAAASGSATLKAAFATNLDTTTYFVKVLPRFHAKLALNSDGTKLVSQAGAGAWIEAMILDNQIIRNGRREQLNPVKHAALTGLNSLREFSITAKVLIAGVPANNLA